MVNISFKAYATVNEIDLNAIAVECGIPKKYTWEEPLVLRGGVLSRVLNKSVTENQGLYIFSFGSIVFADCSPEDEHIGFAYIKNIQNNMITKGFKYIDDYMLHVDSSAENELTDKYVIVSEFEMYQPDIIATCLAKSVGLEKIETEMMNIVDRVEPLIDRQQQGKLHLSERKLATIKSGISRYQYNTIAYIMILDKPDITWTKLEAGEFYDLLSEFFELNDRYEIVTKKTELLNNVMDGLETTSRLVKSTFSEIVVILLILAEVIIMVVELLR